MTSTTPSFLPAPPPPGAWSHLPPPPGPVGPAPKKSNAGAIVLVLFLGGVCAAVLAPIAFLVLLSAAWTGGC